MVNFHWTKRGLYKRAPVYEFSEETAFKMEVKVLDIPMYLAMYRTEDRPDTEKVLQGWNVPLLPFQRNWVINTLSSLWEKILGSWHYSPEKAPCRLPHVTK